MAFWDQIGEFGEQIIDTTTDVVGSIGTNAAAGADANAIKVEIAKTNIELAKANQAAAIKRKERQDALMENILYGLLFLAITVVTVNLVMKYKKPK